MKFARRKPALETASETASETAPAAPEPAQPQPPPGAPVARFAGVLDGRRLWVAVDAAPGRLTLRVHGADAAHGATDVLTLPDDAVAEQQAYLGARLDLAPLLEGADADAGRDADYDVVLVPAPGRPPVPVWTAPLPPRTAPLAPDGRTQFSLARTETGHLRLRSTRLPESAELDAITITPTGVELRVRGHGAEIALLADDDSVIASGRAESVTDRADLRVAQLSAAMVGDAPVQVARVMLGEPGAWVPIRRRSNDLAEPGREALLPRLFADSSSSFDSDGEQRLRLRWSNRGTLRAHLLATDPAVEQA